MAYGPYYYITDWKNEPSQETPINRPNLLKIENGIKEADNRIVQIDAKKAEQSLVNTLVKEITLDTDSGILTVTQQNGSVATYDLAIEKVVTNFDINDDNELVLTLADGTQKVIDLTRFVYSVDSTATVAMKILNRTITAEIVDGSVTMEKLDAAIQMEFRQYMLDTLAARDAALNYQKLAQRYAVGGVVPEDTEDNAEWYYQQTKDIKTQVDASAELVIPHFYIDFATGKLMSDTKAKGKRFWISNGILYGENVYGTMIRYSANPDGTNMTESRQPNSQYVGVGYMPREIYENPNLISSSDTYQNRTVNSWDWLGTGYEQNNLGMKAGDVFTVLSTVKIPSDAPKGVGICARFQKLTPFAQMDAPSTHAERGSALPGEEKEVLSVSTIPIGYEDTVHLRYGRIDANGTGESYTIQGKRDGLFLGNSVTTWKPSPSDWLSDPTNYTWTALNE